MNKTFRYFLIAIAVISVFSGISVAETNAQRINKVLKRMDERLKSLETLSANVKMVNYNSQLGENDVAQGQCIFKVGKSTTNFHVRVDWIRPIAESISVIEDEYTLYRPRLNQIIIGKVHKVTNRSNMQNIFSFMNMSAAQLKENYSFKMLGEKVKLENGIKTTHLELISKNETVYESAEIWADKKGMPIQVKITEKNNDSTTVLLKDLKRNKKIDLKRFTIIYPKNVRIIKG